MYILQNSSTTDGLSCQMIADWSHTCDKYGVTMSLNISTQNCHRRCGYLGKVDCYKDANSVTWNIAPGTAAAIA